jgi:F-type H+-transporting ATPase subunit b
MSRVYLCVLFFIDSLALAAEHGEHELHGIPWGTIGIQAFNLGLLIAVLIYLLRTMVIEHFKGRGQLYTELVERAEAAKTAAEKSHREIAEKLNELQATADQSLKTAQTEAAALKQKLMAEAQTLAKKLEEDSKRSVDVEIEKAKAQLRGELLFEALGATREALKKTVGSTESKRLQTEFADKIQVVGQ